MERITLVSLVATLIFVVVLLFVKAIRYSSDENDKVVLNNTRFVSVGSAMNALLSSSEANQYIVFDVGSK